MFENSITFTVSASREGHWRLAEFCQQAGFNKAIAFRNVHVLAQQQGTLLPFCLFDDSMPPKFIKETIVDIRSCAEIDTCFMPIFLLTLNASENFISQCISSGFDDILKLPCRTAEFAHRAKLQFDLPLAYFKTETYFGPDRRRGNAQVTNEQRQGGAGSDFEKYIIRRNRRTGVKIVSHEKFAADDVMSMFA